MIEYLDLNIIWWHWLIIGFILLILEMNTGTFVILGLGLSAIIVGILDLVMPMTFMNQVLSWIVLSLLSLWAWKRWVKIEHVSNTGQSNYNLDTLGTVTSSIAPNSRGKVTFDTPILGNTTWTATSTHSIDIDSRIKIVEIHGQLIEVEKA
ncbi:MAG: NfeD family protein [Sulfurovum sp.]|nr:NfeD family protein [Sulfurovum sp.]